MAEATIHLPDAMRRVTLTVRTTGAKVLAWRLWLACQCFKIGALIAGCGIVIDSEKH